MFQFCYYDYDEFQNFLSQLPKKLEAKVIYELENLEIYGNCLTMPHSKALGNGLFELRAIQGNNHARVLYFFDKGKIIVITNAYVKKGRKLDKSVLDKAIDIKNEYENMK